MSCASTRCFAGLPGPAFSFSACPWLFSPTPHQGETKPGFSHLGSPLPFNSSTTGSHSFNGAGNPFCWCHFPTLASKSQTGSHTGFSLFCSVSLPTFPLRGKAVFSKLGCPGFLDLSTTGSHGSNGAGNPFRWCRSPTWPPKSHTGPHKAEFGFYLLFSGALAPVGLPTPVPACN